jgi:ribosomal protein S18 acetylase RimI-like enzyme
VEIRTFRTGDRARVVSLWQRCGLVVAWNDPDKDIERKRRQQPDLFMVAVDGETIIGTAMGGYDGHRGSLYYLAVDPPHRRRGIGALLVRTVVEQLRELGCPKLNILVRSSNRAVIGFYEKLGFATDDVMCLGNRLSEDRRS